MYDNHRTETPSNPATCLRLPSRKVVSPGRAARTTAPTTLPHLEHLVHITRKVQQ